MIFFKISEKSRLYLKKNLILVIIIFGILFSLHSSPIITFEKDEHNFGDIREEDGKVECDFIFTNDGDEPLKLIKVKAG